TRIEFTRASHELTTSDLCSIDFDLRLSRGRSANHRTKDKSCKNGRAAHDPCSPLRGRAKTSLPNRALMIDTLKPSSSAVATSREGHRACADTRTPPECHWEGAASRLHLLPPPALGKTGPRRFGSWPRKAESYCS